MADIDISVDNHDLKAAIDLLGSLGSQFVNTVNTIQRDIKKVERAGKASSGVISTALNQVVGAATQRDVQKVRDYWDQFNQRIGITGKTALQTGASFSKLSEIIERETTQAKHYWENFNNSIGIGTRATDFGAGFSALESDIQKLTAKYAPAVAAANRFEKEQEEIKRAAKILNLTIEEQNAAISRLRFEYSAFNNNVMIANSRFNDLTKSGYSAGRGINRFGMYAQQAGYQVGDFAVQVQSGTNVGVAFSQQMAQLAGLIPGLGGALTAFAAIGIGIFIQQMTGAKRAARELNTTISEIKDFSDIFRSAGVTLETSLVRSIERVREHFGDFVADVMDFRMRQLRTSLSADLETAIPRASFTDPEANSSIFTNIFRGIGLSHAPGLSADMMQEANQFNSVMDRVEEIMNSAVNSDLVRTTEDMAEAWVSAHEEVVAYIAAQDIAEDQQQTITDNLTKIAEESGISAQIQQVIQDRERGTLDLLRQGAAARSDYNERLREAAQFHSEESMSLLDQLALQQKINQYGEQSTQVLNEIRMQELARYETELRRQDLNQVQIDSLMSIRASVIDAQQAAQRWENTQKAIYSVLQRISGIDLSGGIRSASSAAEGLLGRLQSVLGVLGQIGRIGMANAALAAENAALASGASPAMARIEGQMVEFNQSLPAGTPQLLRTILNMGQRSALTEGLHLNEENQSLIDAWNDSLDSDSGGSGGGSNNQTSALETIIKEIEQRRRLVGVSEENRRLLEEIIRVENQLGEERENVTNAQIEQLARASLAVEESLRQQEEAEQRHKEMVDNIAGHIDNAIMAVVNGAASIEDSFKSLMRNLISDIYQQTVSQPLSKSISSFLVGLFAANGHAFVGGRVQPFAKGGVVNSPTLFNYSGGAGLMGEAGPEAILPLSRGSDGKLGVKMEGGSSSGSVNITQVFNISANGDETVKRIIQSESKNIVSATKAAVLDAKQRGQRGF